MKENLRALYNNGQNGVSPSVSASGLLNAVAKGWITLEDAVDIIGSDSSLAVIKAAKIAEISTACNTVIVSGTEFPYQADGGVCRIYSAQEIAQIYIAAQTLITTQTTYHNALKAYVQSLDNVESIAAVQYGMTLPDPYATEVAEKLGVAQAQMNAIMARLNG